jgi:ComF family protein
MIDRMLAVVAPHLCSGCGKTGTLLCDDCKYNITSHPFQGCLLCGVPSESGICPHHKTAYTQTWIVGFRQGTLQRLIGGFKFQNMKSAARNLAQLLNERFPSLPAETIIIPIPTSPAHTRERGYDHTLLIAQHFAYMRKLPLNNRLLGRHNTKTQHAANRVNRIEQATSAFQLNGMIDPQATYLLIDDVVTTGSTIQGAARLLSEAGAKKIWVGALARQPLD